MSEETRCLCCVWMNCTVSLKTIDKSVSDLPNRGMRSHRWFGYVRHLNTRHNPSRPDHLCLVTLSMMGRIANLSHRSCTSPLVNLKNCLNSSAPKFCSSKRLYFLWSGSSLDSTEHANSKVTNSRNSVSLMYPQLSSCIIAKSSGRSSWSQQSYSHSVAFATIEGKEVCFSVEICDLFICFTEHTRTQM